MLERMFPQMSVQAKTKASSHLLICDTNIVVKMTLFKQSKMFDAEYSFGEVEIHESVLAEIRRWIDHEGKKARKFGAQLLEDAINRASDHTGRLRGLDPAEMRRSFKALSAMEAALEPHEIGSATSRTDKELLTLAWKNRANLATEERTMRSLGKRSLGKDRVFSFANLVVDLLQIGGISRGEVETGLDTLARYDERLPREEENEIRGAMGAAGKG